MPFLIENKLIDQLKKLSDEFGVTGIKAEFEAEGSDYNDVIRLRNLTGRTSNVDLHVKIGGVEAVRDIIDCLEIGVDGIIAPMVESAFGAQKFISSVKKFEIENTMHCSINIETRSGILDLDSILKVSNGVIDNITVGRSDLSSSYIGKYLTPNSDFIAKKVISVAKRAKEYDYSVTMGGSIDFDTIRLFSKIPDIRSSLNCIETRKVIIPTSILMDNPSVLGEAIKFEEIYVLTKKAYLDRRVKNELNRLTNLKTRT
jgi:4-hydroxy-2-oxoheptanedioate aldolase